MSLLTDEKLQEKKDIILCSRDGYKARLLNWNRTEDVDIIFENGEIRRHMNWTRLIVGKFSYKAIDYSELREGEENVNTQGRKMRIKKYHSYKDMEVEFIEDGVIREHIDYRNFQNGLVIHPEDTIEGKINRYIGRERKSRDGYTAKVIQYKNSNDFTIEFEDGTTKHFSSWKNFNKGNFTYERKNNYQISDGEIENRKKITIKNKEGYSMRLFAWRSYLDVDVIFDDGSIVYNKSYDILQSGAIRHPVYGCLPLKKLEQLESFDTIKKVLRYKNKNDMDVEMYDGTIHEHTTLALCFGRLSKKYSAINLPDEEVDRRLSLIIEKNGRKVHIKEYRDNTDIDLEFDDGVVLKNKTYHQFINKDFKHPDDVTEDSMVSKVMANYKRGARDRGLTFGLSRDEVARIIHEPCYLCGRKDVNKWNISGSDMIYRYNGIDRVDNSKGYFPDNVKPCCFDCNHAKSKGSLSDFLEWVSLISKNMQEGKIAI